MRADIRYYYCRSSSVHDIAFQKKKNLEKSAGLSRKGKLRGAGRDSVFLMISHELEVMCANLHLAKENCVGLFDYLFG